MVTDTNRNMISDSAVSIDSTEARAGILTLPVDAGFVSWAVSIDLTFWPAVGRRAKHLWKTVTLASVADSSWRFTVRSTGIGITGILSHNWFWSRWWSSTRHEWVSEVSLVTDTKRDMIGNLAVGIGATETWAGINTMKIATLLSCRTVSIDDTFRSAGHIRVAKVIWYTLT